MKSRIAPFFLFLLLAPSILSGQVLYVLNSGPNAADNTIAAYIIADGGALVEISARVRTVGTPTAIAVHPSGRFLYVTTNGPASILAYSVDRATGSISLIQTAAHPQGTFPQGAAVDPTGRFLLVSNRDPGSLSAFAIDPNSGALNSLGPPQNVAPQLSTVAIHPNGRFAYTASGGSSNITAMNLTFQNTLSIAAVPGSPFAAGRNPLAMALDPSGKFLFVTFQGDARVGVYSVDSNTGALAPVNGSPFVTPGQPSGVAIDPTGRFLYVANLGDSTVAAFSVNASSGALTRIQLYPAPPGAFGVVVEPTGKYVYVGSRSGALGAFAVNPNNGSLSPVPGSPFPAGLNSIRLTAFQFTPPIVAPVLPETVSNIGNRALPGMPNYGIAPGSVFVVKGRNLGPAEAVEATEPPLPRNLGGVSVSVTIGDVTVEGQMYSVSATELEAVLPSDTPLGDGTLKVKYGTATSRDVPIRVVATSFGISTRNRAGSGPTGWAYVLDEGGERQTRITLVESARAGQTIGVLGTGLGAAEDPAAIELTVGGRRVNVLSVVRSLGPGIDMLVFTLPADVPTGCYVPVLLRAGGVSSNFATISIASAGKECSDTIGWPAATLAAAQSSGQLNKATVYLTRYNFPGMGTEDEIGGNFFNYSFDSLLRLVGADFDMPVGGPPPGSCSGVSGPMEKDALDPPRDPTLPSRRLNAGPLLTVTGPRGTRQSEGSFGEYYDRLGGGIPLFGSQVTPEYLTPGSYTLDNGQGTQQVGAFRATLVVPEPVTWTNYSEIGDVPRTEGLTVKWSGGDATKEAVFVYAFSSDPATKTASAVLCAERASAGTFTIPAAVLSTLVPSGSISAGPGGPTLPTGLLVVGTNSFSSLAPIQAQGIDFGSFGYRLLSIKFTAFQ